MYVTHRMRQPDQLPLCGFYHPPVGMAGRGHAKRRGQIQILFPVGIPNVYIPGTLPNNRPGTVRIGEEDISRFVTAQQMQDLSGLSHNL